MVFKSTAYRLGYGKNINGEMQEDGSFVIFYKSRDNLVRVKEFVRQAGRVELKSRGQEFNASSVLPVSGGYILTRAGNEIKSIKI